MPIDLPPPSKPPPPTSGFGNHPRADARADRVAAARARTSPAWAKHGVIPVRAIVIQVVIALGLLFTRTPRSPAPAPFSTACCACPPTDSSRGCSSSSAPSSSACSAPFRLRGSCMPRVEFYHLVLVITAAMMFAQSNHFVMFFVALETITVGFYILVSYFRESPLSLRGRPESIWSWARSALSILLFSGIVLLYGCGQPQRCSGSSADAMNFDQLRVSRREPRQLPRQRRNRLRARGRGLQDRRRALPDLDS